MPARLDYLSRHSDGFKLAEYDLNDRGGADADVDGHKQSGKLRKSPFHGDPPPQDLVSRGPAEQTPSRRVQHTRNPISEVNAMSAHTRTVEAPPDIHEMLAGLGVADHAACVAFAARQAASAEGLESLERATVVLDDVLGTLWLEHPAELMAYRTPDVFPPLSETVIRTALDAASRGDSAATRAALADLAFVHWVALRSSTAFLRAEAARYRRHPRPTAS